ncbi:uncharacterized protein CCOS01_14846 [Colletotrichum costaricense]|uniref:Uncharacterized protein n=1 Tax=Colletotrichum costaricense TaxID=1209916 RepID=A0AAI9YHY7_9PEZI|nr:uncharacterized protein CCOS01_14846 [Colletotrichum costaricense]KAK1511084.1 hypothetical protein CCOS01_14846 [Colletotrichum costaricense]
MGIVTSGPMSTSGKSPHTHSTTESNGALSEHRISAFSQSAGHSNMHHVQNKGTDATASKAYHETRMAGVLADFEKQFGSHPPRHP